MGMFVFLFLCSSVCASVFLCMACFGLHLRVSVCLFVVVRVFVCGVAI